MRRRVLGSVLILALALGLAACGDDDGDAPNATTSVPGGSEESQETANFCQELVEFGTQAGNLNLSSPQAMAEWAEEVGTQARELAASAPPAIRDEAQEYASQAENLAEEIAAGRSEAANDINNRLTEALSKMTTFAQQNCPAAGAPTTAPGSGG
jgi:hypothetical protein